MRVKQSLSDFIVKELISEGFIKPKGEYEVYLLKKKGVDTLSVIRELSKRFGKIGYAGLKDKHGLTEQYVTMKKGAELKTSNYELKKVGYSDKQLRRGDNTGNEFIIKVELSPDEMGLMKKNEDRVRGGFKNYYDTQRTGHELIHTSMINYLIKGDYKTALLRYYIHKSKYAKPFAKKAYKECFKQWGDWVKCYNSLKGKVSELTLRPLKELMKSGNLIKAIKSIPSDELELMIAGYQALLFNEMIKEEQEGVVELPVISVPELRLKPRKGRRQVIVKPIDLKIKYEGNEAVLSFKLPRGAYATVLVKTLLSQ